MTDRVHGLATHERDRLTDWSNYWQVIFNEKKTLFFITAGFFIATSFIFSFVPNVYETEVQILVEKMGEKERLNTQAVSADFRGEDDYYGTQVTLMTGRKIYERLREEFRAVSTPYQLSARRIRGTRIIALTARSKDPELAARVANKAIDFYIEDKMQDDLFFQKQMLKWIPEEVEIPSPVLVSEPKDVVDTAPSEEAVAEEAVIEDDNAENAWTALASDRIYQQLRKDRLDAESKLNELSSRYRSGHPVVKDLNEKITYMDQQMKTQREKLLGGLKASLAGQMHLTNVKILSPAIIPLKATSPKRAQGIFFATVLGFFVGVFLILYAEQADRHLWREEDLRSIIDVPFMGCIPLIPGLAARHDKEGKKKGIVPKFSENLLLQTIIKDNPVLVDATALVRTYLLFSIPYEKAKMLMMTSATPNEGKSTVAGLLAMSLASMGRKILLIDADLRRPYLNANLGVENKTGLAEYLSGEVEMKDIVKAVPDSTLKMISGGFLKSNPTHLLASPRFKELLDAMMLEYDRILIDAPPVLFIPDGLMIAKYVQGTILVTGAGMIRQKVLQTVKHKFDLMSRPLVGSIMNLADYNLDLKHQWYFKQYKDYYYTGEGGQHSHTKDGKAKDQ